MKAIITCISLIFVSLTLIGQSGEAITLGNIQTLDSKILEEERPIWVYVPDGDLEGKNSYPVVYLLDGDAHFYSVVGMVHQLSSINGNTNCPKMIVVGIPNTNRTRDLTPSKGSPQDPFIDSAMRAISGGGAAFMSFIEKELIPFVDSTYPTKPYRMLIGHSFGGLTVMNTFFHHPEIFNSYVSIDPSMWWADQELLKEIQAYGQADKYENKSLFMGIANTMPAGMDTSAVRKDVSPSTKHIRSILALDDAMKSASNDTWRYRSAYYPEDTHGSVPMITTYDALRFIFSNLNLVIGLEEILNPKKDFFERVVKHYKDLSEEFGYEMKPEEGLINQLGYGMMQNGHMEMAGKFFQLNVKNYPQSGNVYDSYGDYFMAVGNNDKAIESFRKALEIQEVSYTRDKLEQLLKE